MLISRCFEIFFNTNITKDKRCVVDQHGNEKNRPVVLLKMIFLTFFHSARTPAAILSVEGRTFPTDVYYILRFGATLHKRFFNFRVL